MNRSRLIRLLIAGLVGLLLAAVVAWWSIQQDRRAAGPAGASTEAGTVLGGVSIGGPFSLVDHTGKPVTDKDYAGKYKLVFFGFTFCPDICPTELQVLAQAMDALGDDAARVQPLFISIDPQRDTPAQLAEYVAMFHPSITGLTGTPEQVAAVAKAYRVYYAKAPGGNGDDYLMDHSTFTYLMGPDGQFLKVLPRGTSPDEIVQSIRSYLARG